MEAVVDVIVVNRHSHAKMPSTLPVPAMLQASMMQRGRSWEGVLQRLSGPRQRAVGEGSPERGVRAKPRWFGAQSAESGHEEQNIPSQDLARGSRKNKNAKTLAGISGTQH